MAADTDAPVPGQKAQTRPISISPMKNATNHTLDGPAFTFTGVRLTVLAVKSFFFRTLDLGMATSPDGVGATMVPIGL